MNEFLTSREAAAALRVSIRTLRRFVAAGKVRPTRLSLRTLRYSRAELDRLARPRRMTTAGK